VNVRDADGIERHVATFGRSANGGLVVTASGLANFHHKLIIALAAQHGPQSGHRSHLLDAALNGTDRGNSKQQLRKRAAIWAANLTEDQAPATPRVSHV
jgi:putative ABC transport system substrate-binding protein